MELVRQRNPPELRFNFCERKGLLYRCFVQYLLYQFCRMPKYELPSVPLRVDVRPARLLSGAVRLHLSSACLPRIVILRGRLAGLFELFKGTSKRNKDHCLTEEHDALDGRARIG